MRIGPIARTIGPSGTTLGSMSAQSIDQFGQDRPGIRVARTIRAVRAALPEDQRAKFAAEMEDGDVAAVLNRWWMRAVAYTTSSVAAGFAALDAGTLRTVPAADVLVTRAA